MKTSTINIAEDFTPFPAGRYAKDGPFTGEGFRKRILAPALRKNDLVTIQLDGATGYGSSFLEEAFGGLVREEGFSEKELQEKLTVAGKRKSLIDSIHKYIHDAQLQKLVDQNGR